MLVVYIHNRCISDYHNSKILAGLSYLHAQRRIKLKISKSHFPGRICRLIFDRFTFWVRVEDTDNGRARDICFDMQDSAGFHYHELLEACDVYFKRSHRQECVEMLDPLLQKKIQPFGLNFACSSPYYKFVFRLLLAALLSNRVAPGTKSKHFRKLYGSFLQASFPSFNMSGSHCQPPVSSHFESVPNIVSQPRIIFQTRTWDPQGHKWLSLETLKEINDSRAETIRTLRHAFGDKVIAGFSANAYALKHYPDCVTTQRSDKEGYLALMRGSTICVQKIGLYGSSGWKLAEYFAGGKCIVTEPVLDTLPVPLQNGKNILTFTNPDKCVAACRYLLENPAAAKKMAIDNFLYYLSEVEPSAHIYKCLTLRAFDDVSSGQSYSHT